MNARGRSDEAFRFMTEAAKIRLHRARSWLRKTHDASDTASRFIFLWVAFNALYGRPRYRRDISLPRDETQDFIGFLGELDGLSRGAIGDVMRRVEADVEKILQNPFLVRECGESWDKGQIRDRGRRRATASVQYDKAHRVEQVVRRLYTLRNQLLHGAATAGGRRNDESLRHAIPILAMVVPEVVRLVALHHAKMSTIEPLPYAPSIGDDGGFNSPRMTSR
jgi:hypothetical protein